MELSASLRSGSWRLLCGSVAAWRRGACREHIPRDGPGFTSADGYRVRNICSESRQEIHGANDVEEHARLSKSAQHAGRWANSKQRTPET